ncbi:hypothetical protein LEN26_001587 [Aphanomyces euteiches]|nr:hypothetical protein AeMF1_015536 [Aphanomyces euteiches]KAH9161073.1 hypothetical protein LEN26_001587 [Aphanomyces euteiches]KAH9189946.1 hypothetical protein AeNC1_008071 [Aphanomyces euteiches]
MLDPSAVPSLRESIRSKSTEYLSSHEGKRSRGSFFAPATVVPNESAPLLPLHNTTKCIDLDVASVEETTKPTCSGYVNEVGINCLSGVIAFMLTSTIAVSTANVLVGTSGPLSAYVANAIDMHLLGTALMCVFLSWRSSVPYAMGAIDASVVPILAGMAQSISHRLGHNMVIAVPTVLVASALSSVFIGVLLFSLGYFRVTSVVNYLPYPVIAGFLSGLGGVLIKDGIEISSSVSFPTSLETIALVLPTIVFAVLATAAKQFHISPNVVFPTLIIGSIVGFHIIASSASIDTAPWLFNWSSKMLRETPRWYSWAEIAWSEVSWSVLGLAFLEIVPTLLLLISLKYSVLIGSLSTIFRQNVNVDFEVETIGKANILAGLLGCCGGTHYVSAMALMANFKAHPRAPVLICAVLLVLLWGVGLKPLLVIPKFVFGGLLMYIGFHFLENYMIAPAAFLSRLEVATILITFLTFLTLGVLPSVGLGVVLSMLTALMDLHVSGCVKDCARMHDNATFMLRLHGNLSFANAMQVLDLVKSQWLTLPYETLVLDFESVLLVDGTFVQILRRVQGVADNCHFEIHLCHVPTQIQSRFAALKIRRHESFHHFMDAHHTNVAAKRGNQLYDSWNTFVQHHVAFEKVAPVVAKYLDEVENLPPQTMLRADNDISWTFLCVGQIEVYDASMQTKLGVLQPGDIVPVVPSQNVLAQSNCVVLRIRAESWRQLQKAAPSVAITMLESTHRAFGHRAVQK